MDVQSRYDLIAKNLVEVLGDKEEMKKIISQRPLKIYWGTAPTGTIHIGYLLPMLKIADFIDANCEVTVLLADIHATFDNLKSTPEQVKYRTNYYETMIIQLANILQIDITKLRFVKGSDFQYNKDYVNDVYKSQTIVKVNDAKHAGSEVVKQTENSTMSSLLYPSFQSLDLPYLNCDAFAGGLDQRKIAVFSQSLLPKLGYAKGFYLLNPMLPSLSKTANSSGKMSASDQSSKIDLLDEPKDIKKKISACYCLPGNIDDNNLLVFARSVIFPILGRMTTRFTINRPEKYGGILTYDSYQTLEDDFREEKLHPIDLKLGISDHLTTFLDPLRKVFKQDEFRDILAKAYQS